MYIYILYMLKKEKDNCNDNNKRRDHEFGEVSKYNSRGSKDVKDIDLGIMCEVFKNLT